MGCPLIAFIGPDGSGKTTQVDLAAKALRERGYSVHRTYGRVVPVISRPLLWATRVKQLFTQTGMAEERPGDRRLTNPDTALTGISAWLFETAFKLDLLIQNVIRIKLPLLFADVLLADRYAQDSLITDFATHLAWSSKRTSEEYRRLLRLGLPAPGLEFYLRVQAEEAIRRKDDIDSEQAHRTLVERYNDAQFTGNRQVHLDASRSPSEIHEDVLSELTDFLEIEE